MYDKIQIRTYTGPSGQQEAIKRLLGVCRIPAHSASVYEQNNDTGYPGLAVTSTCVDLHVNDRDLAKKVDESLCNMGFSQAR